MREDNLTEIESSVSAEDHCCSVWLLHQVYKPQSGGSLLLALKQKPRSKEMAQSLQTADSVLYHLG